MTNLHPHPHRHTAAHRILRTLRPLALAATACIASLPATAALVARNLDGDASTAEAYHDTTLGITWLRDTDLLANRYGLGTTMSYAAATTALAAFNADASLNLGFAGWRLPGATGVHTLGGAGCQFGVNGSTDCGENVNTTSSELASMFHDTLGNLSWRDTTGAVRPGSAGTDFGLVDTADFLDLAAVGYWSGTTSYRLIFGAPQHGQVVFRLSDGSQSINAPTALNAAWLVHGGDIGTAVVPAAAVPLPGSLSLAALGLVLLARRRTA
jgi:hypothetical protein